MQIHFYLIKLVEKSGKETIFHITSLDENIAYRADNGESFDDEAWFLSGWCEKNNIEPFYARKTIDISDVKWWFNTYHCAE